jgi:acyl-CoA reductase-like NAD-dependent aldehyde dehydrogenase
MQIPLFVGIDPANGAQISSFPDMDVDEAERAIQAAKKALPEWSQMTAKVRGGEENVTKIAHCDYYRDADTAFYSSDLDT